MTFVSTGVNDTRRRARRHRRPDHQGRHQARRPRARVPRHRLRPVGRHPGGFEGTTHQPQGVGRRLQPAVGAKLVVIGDKVNVVLAVEAVLQAAEAPRRLISTARDTQKRPPGQSGGRSHTRKSQQLTGGMARARGTTSEDPQRRQRAKRRRKGPRSSDLAQMKKVRTALDDHRHALAAADAHRDQAGGLVVEVQRVEHRGL